MYPISLLYLSPQGLGQHDLLLSWQLLDMGDNLPQQCSHEILRSCLKSHDRNDVCLRSCQHPNSPLH